jgi:hypothetical protein
VIFSCSTAGGWRDPPDARRDRRAILTDESLDGDWIGTVPDLSTLRRQLRRNADDRRSTSSSSASRRSTARRPTSLTGSAAIRPSRPGPMPPTRPARSTATRSRPCSTPSPRSRW